MVCRGTNCDVTFNACNFDGCKLVAMEEAQVHLVDSLLEASMSDIGLLARGEGTVVDAQNCIIMNGIQSASAQDGACIILQDCSCSGATVVGVEVRGEGAIIKIQGSFVGDMKGAGKVTTSAPTTPTVASVATGALSFCAYYLLVCETLCEFSRTGAAAVSVVLFSPSTIPNYTGTLYFSLSIRRNSSLHAFASTSLPGLVNVSLTER